jgi:hypothetical protein
MKKTSIAKSGKFASGGKGADQHMFGKNDRTVTDARDAAGPQTPNQTAQHSANRVRSPQVSDNVAGDSGGSPGAAMPRRPG